MYVFDMIIKIWGCLKLGYLQIHPFTDGFSMVNYPAIGVPPFVEASLMLRGSSRLSHPRCF